MFKKIKKGIYVLRNEGLREFLKRTFNYFKRIFVEKPINFGSRFFLSFIIPKIKNFHSSNPEEIFSFAWNFYFGLIRPMQIKEEFVELLKIFQEKNPKYILEIGTANGGSLFCFCKLARDDAVIISLDLPKGPFGGGYPEWKIHLYQSFAKENQKLYLLRKDSHQKETLEEVQKILGENKLDFIFIDGDHSYEGVKKDFEMYSQLVKRGGIIAFHDIAPFGNEKFVGGVPKFWQEIKNNFNHREIIKDINQEFCGIGLIYN